MSARKVKKHCQPGKGAHASLQKAARGASERAKADCPKGAYAASFCCT